MTTARRKLLAIAVTGLVLAVVIAPSGWSFLRDRINTISVTAQFDSAAGLYEGNTVAVLGMPVGRVTKITPKGGYVEVEFTVNRDVQVPADAQAVTDLELDSHRPPDRADTALPRWSHVAEPRHHRTQPHQDPRRIRPGTRCSG